MNAPLWESIAWLLGLLAAIALGDYGAVLLVRAEERQREQDAEAKRVAARAERRLHRPPASEGANSPTQAPRCRPALAGPRPIACPAGSHFDATAGWRCPTCGQDKAVCEVCAPSLLATAQSSDRCMP